MNYQAGWSEQLVQDYFAHQYRDRGMTKWQGYYLSDHTSALNKAKQAAAVTYPPRPQQSPEQIGVILADAFANSHPVAIQLTSIAPNGEYGPDILGLVRGYTDTDVVIGSSRIDLETIRNVRVL
ncbi:hypothetical protein [Lacticaseibacillus hulanensis]|uniref:hypothetical protein n=1 Tax=Lacticaseibacillus hulanensis TaxID=2493111 RepID=UPI000FD82BA7|nr:hypothetical protein [Lacticaseibacillus hulanensis]